MIRSELCAVAEIAPATFNSHRRNGDLPFNIAAKELNDSAGRTWSRFDLDDAHLLIAAKSLAQGQGVSWSEAARMLREPALHLETDFDNDSGTYLPGIHCARVEFRCEGGEIPFIFPRYLVVRGTLAKIADYAQRAADQHNEEARFPHDRISVFSIAAVNLTQAWHIAAQRAEALQIDTGEDTDEGAE